MYSFLLIYFVFFIEISFSETAKETARMVISDSQITLLTSDIEFLPNSTTLSQTQNFYIKNYGKICDFSYPDDIIQNCIIKYINYNRNWILIVDSVDDLISILTCKDLRNYPISAIIAKDSIPSLTTFDFTKYNMDVPIYTSPSAIYDRIVSMYTIEKEGDNVIVEISYFSKGRLCLVNVSFYLSLSLVLLCISVSAAWTGAMKCYKDYFPPNHTMTIQSMLRSYSYFKIVAALFICYYYELQLTNINENNNSTSIEIYLNMVIVTLNSILITVLWFFLILICYGWLIYKNNFTRNEFKRLTLYFIMLYVGISMDQIVDLFFNNVTISFSDWKNFIVFSLLGFLCISLVRTTVKILRMKYTYAANYSREFLPSLKLKINNIKWHLGVCITYVCFNLAVIVNLIVFREVLKDLVTLIKCFVDVFCVIALMVIYHRRKFSVHYFTYAEETQESFLQEREILYWTTRNVYTFRGSFDFGKWNGTFKEGLSKNEMKGITKNRHYPVIVLTPFGTSVIAKGSKIHIGYFNNKK